MILLNYYFSDHKTIIILPHGSLHIITLKFAEKTLAAGNSTGNAWHSGLARDLVIIEAPRWSPTVFETIMVIRPSTGWKNIITAPVRNNDVVKIALQSERFKRKTLLYRTMPSNGAIFGESHYIAIFDRTRCWLAQINYNGNV